jgi:hypothetical protein
MSTGELRIVPATLAQAAAFVADWHRHHPDTVGHRFSIGIAQGDELVGVVIVGNPSGRWNDGLTLEVIRTCVADGIPNGNSMLYGAAWRAAKALGWRRLVTYTQEGESGASLRAAGWRLIAERPARHGTGRANRPRRKSADGVQRTLWEAS